MISKKQMQFVNSLKQKKFRDEHNLFIAEGVKIVSELLKSTLTVRQLFGTADYFKNIEITKTVEIIEVKQNELERISSLASPNEVIAVCEIPTRLLVLDSLKHKLTLVLDDINDPGNLGTIIRIANWFGINDIVCSNESADAFNPKVVQATMGSIARINIYYCDLVSIIGNYKSTLNQPVYGTLLEGEDIYSQTLSSSGLILIGNESRGISEKLFPLITNKLKIPLFANDSTIGVAESLNAAVATAIVCSEFRRDKN